MFSRAPDGGKSCWGNGFPPTVHQGVEFRSKGDPVSFVSNPAGVDDGARRASLDLIHDLNQAHRADAGDPEIDTRIAAYEMAYRMQSSVPELTDLSKEPAAMHELYGSQPGQVSFGNNCLLARRLVERGVRFVQRAATLRRRRRRPPGGRLFGQPIATAWTRHDSEPSPPGSDTRTNDEQMGALGEVGPQYCPTCHKHVNLIDVGSHWVAEKLSPAMVVN